MPLSWPRVSIPDVQVCPEVKLELSYLAVNCFNSTLGMSHNGGVGGKYGGNRHFPEEEGLLGPGNVTTDFPNLGLFFRHLYPVLALKKNGMQGPGTNSIYVIRRNSYHSLFLGQKD